MKTVFADTSFWIGTAKPGDPWADAAKEAKRRLADARIVTTDEVLVEFLGFLGKCGPNMREAAAAMIRRILDDPGIEVVEQSRDSFLRGLELYRQRADKDYSLVDCVCMNVMKAEGIQEVLTSDGHFSREGFTVLMSVDS